jgi:hypothetical protein
MRSQMDQMSDILKNIARMNYEADSKLPEVEIAGWFVNVGGARPGPQFDSTPEHMGQNGQPLFLTPAFPGQPVIAWRGSTGSGWLYATHESRGLYRDDLDWQPLYSAR